ncbi:MAG: alpha/beta hydrolase [Patulibacter minatonensis]
MPIARSEIRSLLVATAAGLALAPAASAAPAPAVAKPPATPPPLVWTDCGGGFQCATATVPLSYAQPRAGTTTIALVKKPATGDPAQRIGSLFTNPGGPGGSGTSFVRATAGSLYATLNTRYDIVGFDPRGTGESGGALDCGVNQETDGIYSQPFPTPKTVDPGGLLRKDAAYVARCVQKNRAILPFVTTGNVARDLDGLRAQVGDQKLNYLGFSYGTFLGATYSAMYPNRIGHVVLDGPLDASQYVNDPQTNLAEQTAGFEDSLDRFLDACKADQVACAGFGGADPHAAYDALLAKADATPLLADSYPDDPRPVDGDDIRFATSGMLYAKFLWPYLAQELAAAQAGDGGPLRAEVDGSYGYDPADGSFDPGNDRYFLIGAIDQVKGYPHGNLLQYFRSGAKAYREAPHFWFNNGYVELNYGLFTVPADGLFRGPFRVPGKANTPLVVATTHDPATPYGGALGLVKQLGNARLLTMEGDNHTAYGGESPCIDAGVEAYLFDGTLPAAGTVCQQEHPFAQPEPEPSTEALSGSTERSARARPAAIRAITQAAQPGGPGTKPVDPAN